MRACVALCALALASMAGIAFGACDVTNLFALYPLANTTLEVGTKNVTMKWSAFPSAYCSGATMTAKLNIGSGDVPCSVSEANISSTAVFECTVDITAATPGKLTWHVESDQVGTTSSENVDICLRGAPGAPTLTAIPAESPGRPIFQWSEPAWGEPCDTTAEQTYALWLGQQLSNESFGARGRWLLGVFNSTADRKFQPDEFLAPGDYSWYVEASNGGIVATESAVGTFSVCDATAPAAPALVNFVTTSDSQPTLSWTHSGSWGAECSNPTANRKFVIYVGQSIEPQSDPNVIVDTVSGSTLSWQVTEKLVNGLYRWRVVAVNSALIEAFSMTSAFKVAASEQPDPPVAIFPPDSGYVEWNGTAAEVEIEFAWRGVNWGSRNVFTNPPFYTFQLGSSTPVDVGTNQTITLMVSTASTPVTWSVIANNGQQASSTASFSFDFCTPSGVTAPGLSLSSGAIPAVDTTSIQGFNVTLEDCSDDATHSGIALSLVSGSAYNRFVVLPTAATSYTPSTKLEAGVWTATATTFSGVETATNALSFSVCKTGPSPVPSFSSPAAYSVVASNLVVVRYTVPAFSSDYCGICASVTISKLNWNATGGPLAYSSECVPDGTLQFACNFTVPDGFTGAVQFQAEVSNGCGTTLSPIRVAFIGATENVDSAPVVPSSPADGAIVAVDSIKLAWEPSLVGYLMNAPSADRSYHVLVQFNETDVQTTTTAETSVTITGLATATTYTWKVRPYSGDGLPIWSSPRSFTTCDPTATPALTLLSPAQDATVSLPLTVSWSPITWAGCGTESIDVSINGGAVVVLPGTAEQHVYDSATLPKTGSFTVTVNARQGNKVSTATRTITICDPETPKSPKLISPDDGTELNVTEGLSWTAVSISSNCLSTAEVSYRVLISTVKGGEMALFATTTSTSLAPFHLNSSGVFYWTVEATNGVHASEQPAPFSFYSCLEHGPESFSSVYPAANGGANSPVMFEWEMTSFGDDCPVGGVNQSGGYVFRLQSAGDGGAALNQTVSLETGVTTHEVDLTTGEYVWWVEKWSDIGSVSTLQNNFHVCEVTSPEAPVLTAMTGKVVSPPTFTWEAVTDWGDSCAGPMGLDHKYLVFVGQDDLGAPRFVGDTTETSFTPEAGQVLRGVQRLRVIATNGVKSSASETTFEACTAMAPPEPVLIYPASATINLPRSLNFTVAPVNLWGETCDAENGGWYKLYVADPSASEDATVVSAVHSSEVTFDEQGYAQIPATLTIQSWSWTVGTNNTLGLESSMPTERIVRICENIVPDKPVITAPANGSTVSVYYFNAEWDLYASTCYGAVCPNATHANVLTPLLRLMWSYSPSENFSLVNYILYETSREMPYGTMPTELPKDTDIFIKLVSSNGLLSSESDLLTLRTMPINCDDVYCVLDHGSCNKINLTCDCLPGYSGNGCEHDDVWARNLKIILGVVIGGGGFLIIAVSVVVFFVRRYYRKSKRIILEPPNFNDLRAPPVKAPTFPPDVTTAPDYAMLEEAAMCDNGFEMMWQVMKNTAVTEADSLAKAMVYTYQRHGKGLELIFFLVMREIHDATDESTLFRANSPATRAFKFYSKMVGLPYLFQTLAVLLQGVLRDIEDAEEDQRKKNGEAASSSSTVSMATMQTDLDPEKIDACSDESLNTLTLQLSCQKFLLQIMRSDKNVPGEIKHICAFVRSQLEAKFPGAVYRSLGGFVFMRFYYTAITAPEAYGLMPHSPSGTARRQLILISKVLQNLANGTEFGSTEPSLVKLNTLVTSSKAQYERFLDKLCDNTAQISEPIPISDESYQNSLATVLAQIYTISRADPDKLNTLRLTPALFDLVNTTVPASSRHKKKKHHHHADKSKSPAEAARLLPDDATPGAV